MSETFDPRDLRPRGPYGRRTTDQPLRRPVDENPAGLVDVMLYGRVCGAHLDAERAYFAILDRELDEKPWTEERKRLRDLGAAANGKAEGLAEAVAILDGRDVVEVRRKASETLERERERGLSGVDRARGALEESISG